MEQLLPTLSPKAQQNFTIFTHAIRNDMQIPENYISNESAYRFFTGMNGDLTKSIESVRKAFEWRKVYPFKDMHKVDPQKNILLAQYFKHGFYGYDLEGKPVAIVKATAVDPAVFTTEFTTDELIAIIVEALERLIWQVLPSCSRRAGRSSTTRASPSARQRACSGRCSWPDSSASWTPRRSRGR